jgi:large subunit ribosomal protein L2
MGIKKFRPVTPTLRYKTVLDKAEITEEKPFKPLTKGKTGDSGRGFKGQVTVRRRGGGHKRKLRLIDLKETNTAYLVSCFNRI